MEKLTDAQTLDIQRFLNKNLGNSFVVADELLDHLCILTELEMQAGKPFADALKAAYSQLDKAALQEIRTTENILAWTNKRLLDSLLVLIICAAIIGFTLFFLKIKGFRLAWIAALILLGYIFLPLFALRKWAIFPHKITDTIFFFIGFIQLNGLVFMIIKLRWWKYAVPIMLLGLIVGAVIWIKNKYVKER